MRTEEQEQQEQQDNRTTGQQGKKKKGGQQYYLFLSPLSEVPRISVLHHDIQSAPLYELAEVEI
jgi:hypothetical protein